MRSPQTIRNPQKIRKAGGARKEGTRRTLLQVGNVAASERDADFVDFGAGHGGTSSVIFFFTLSDVTHLVFAVLKR